MAAGRDAVQPVAERWAEVLQTWAGARPARRAAPGPGAV